MFEVNDIARQLETGDVGIVTEIVVERPEIVTIQFDDDPADYGSYGCGEIELLVSRKFHQCRRQAVCSLDSCNGSNCPDYSEA